METGHGIKYVSYHNSNSFCTVGYKTGGHPVWSVIELFRRFKYSSCFYPIYDAVVGEP